VAAVQQMMAAPRALHGRHPLPARWRGPTSPLQGEVDRRRRLGMVTRR